MKSKWRVAYNPMLKPTPYGVYRLKDLHRADHSSNRETLPELYATRNEAKAKADELNKAEQGGKRTMMTNWTMELLEQVLRKQAITDDYIDAVANALERFRASGSPMDEQALRKAARDYLGYL